MKFGIVTAIVTPIDETNSVDEKSLRHIIDIQLQNEAQSICALGGTGEYVALSVGERKRIIDITVDQVKGKVPVVVGACSPGIYDCIEIGAYAKAAGADAILLITPYGVKGTNDGIIEYFKVFDKAVDMPFIIYNFPPRTGVDLEVSVINTLAEQINNLVGLKESVSDVGKVIDLLNRVGDKIQILCGDEYSMVLQMVLGVDGGVLASPNVIAGFWPMLWKLVKDGKVDEAIRIHAQYQPFIKALFIESNPGPLKEAMRLAGLPAGFVRPPLCRASSSTIETLRSNMERLGLLDKYKADR